LDGELSLERRTHAETHINACSVCAAALSDAEGELDMFTQAFAVEDASVVPSERLRERIETAIGSIRSTEIAPAFSANAARGGSVREWFSTLVSSLSLTPARATAFAGIAAVVAFAAIFAVMQPALKDKGRGAETASNQPAPEVVNESRPDNSTVAEISNPPSSFDNPAIADAPPVQNNTGEIVKARFSRKAAVRAEQTRKTTPAARRSVEAKDATLSGEDKFLESIATLEKAVRAGGDLVLRPSVRAEYERNVAVVDRAISASRRNALRNPKDAEAVKFLFSAYQSKIELMSAVADQTQFAVLER
jgi:hypothetical protein